MINPVITIILLMIMGFTAPLLYKRMSVIFKFILLIVIIFNIAEFIVIMPTVVQQPYNVNMGNIMPPFGIMLSFGLTGSVLALLVNFVALGILIFKMGGKHDSKHPAVFYTVFPVLTASLISLINTQDIFNMFVFIEIVTIAIYILAGIGENKNSEISVIRFITGTSIGSLLMLTGIAGIYSLTGTLNIPHIVSMINGYADFNLHMFNISALLFIAGMMFEAYMFPFNMFVIDIYRTSDESGDAIYSGMTQTAVLFITAKFIHLFISNPLFLNLIMILGIITIIAGQLSAFAESNKRRMLAFSSFSMSGLVMTLIAAGAKADMSNEMFTLALLMIIIHGICKFIMFLSISAFTDSEGKLANNARAGQFSLFAFVIALLTLSGIPPFPGFYVKFRIITELMRMNYTWIAVIIIISALIEIIYLLRTTREFTLVNTARSSESVFTMIPVVVTMILILLFTVNPENMYRASNKLDFMGETDNAVNEIENNLLNTGKTDIPRINEE